MKPAIVFRCNVSPTVGMGHLTRSRTFAAELNRRNQRCIMVGPGLDYVVPADESLFDGWHPSAEWPSSASVAAEFVEIARASGATRAVVDDYRADEEFQDALAGAGMIWMQHFDASRTQRFRASMMVHGSPSETAERWRPYLLNPDTEMLFGPQYAVLRPEFPPANLRPDRREVGRILISFGGGDDKGATILTLQSLAELPSTISLAIMSGARNPNIPAIEQWISTHGRKRAELHIQPPDVARLFASCDLALLGGGISIYEAASCGLPMILMALADNQLRQCEGWQELGAAVFAGPVDKVAQATLTSIANRLIADEARRAQMSAIGRQSVDGRGAERLAAHILKDWA